MAIGLARLKTRADFLRVAASRRRAVRPGLILQEAPRPPTNMPEDGGGEMVRVGFTASRKVGNAVVRNRAKRRLRAAAAQVLTDRGRRGLDYVLVARAAIAERAYGDIVADIETALRQLERPRNRPGGDARHRRSEET